ncbi:50S ribosomal protein L23, partial [candidate division WOR-3 bacterium]|nr:50S ribosomal protein L23 [candidate division WOR-3 bacterium]
KTMVVKGKMRRIGWTRGKRKDWKKAIVTLKPGDTIPLFEGV